MKNDVLDDAWLKNELTDDYIDDGDFSFTVVEKIAQHESNNKRYLYTISAIIVGIMSYLFIPELMILLTNSPVYSSANSQDITSLTSVELMGIFVVMLVFILIWSFEDLDLI